MSRLALFDLDNTLLAGDSDHAWGEFLISQGLVDEATHRSNNDRFYQSYLAGELDIHAYVKFTLSPVLNLELAELNSLHEKFMRDVIKPMILTSATELVQGHRDQGDRCIMITATNSFITKPIAREFAIDQLLATDLELQDGKFTGNIAGIPCYQSGKVEKLQQWLTEQNEPLAIKDGIFYSDSINDLPLLEMVAEPIAVDPDDDLGKTASDRGWRTLSLRG